MAYIKKFDTTIWEKASKLSCEHMNNLAINELYCNKTILDTNTNHPSCHRFIEDPDRPLEFDMLTGFSISKKSCVYKRPEYIDGHWNNQFAIYNPYTNKIGCSITETFNENSKAKTNNNNNKCTNNVVLSNDKNKLTTSFNDGYHDLT